METLLAPFKFCEGQNYATISVIPLLISSIRTRLQVAVSEISSGAFVEGDTAHPLPCQSNAASVLGSEMMAVFEER